MAPPLLAPLVGGGLFAGGAAAVSKGATRVSNWLGRNTGRAGAGAGGAIGGFGLSEIMDQLGIEDDRLRIATVAALVIAALVAIGQILEFQVDV